MSLDRIVQTEEKANSTPPAQGGEYLSSGKSPVDTPDKTVFLDLQEPQITLSYL